MNASVCTKCPLTTRWPRGVAPPVRVLLIDDSRAYLDALTARLSTYPDLEVVGRAETGLDGLRLAGELSPGLVLLDLGLPDLHGLEVARRLREAYPDLPIVVLASHDSDAYRAATLELFAGFVQKHRAGEELVPSIRAILSDRAARPERGRPSTRGAPDDGGCADRMEQLALLVDGGQGMLALVDANGALEYVSRAAAGLLGAAPADLVGTHLLDWVHPADAESMRGALDRGRADERVAVLARLRARSEGWRETCADVGSVARLAQDSSLIEESETRFRQIAETIEEVFWLTDVEKRRMIYVSPAYERIWGRSCESLYQDPRSWLDAIHPEDRQRILEAALGLQASGEYDVNYRIVRPDGAVRWIHDRAFPVREPDRKIRRVAGAAADVTHRRQLEQRLEDSQTHVAIGRLALDVAHDFNNMLCVIQAQGSCFEDDPTLAPEARQGIDVIMTAARNAATLSRQLLSFGARHFGRAKAAPEIVDVGDSTQRMLGLFRRVFGAGVSLECDVADDLPRIRAVAGMIDKVTLNLIVNAHDAMPAGGVIRVRVDRAEGELPERPDTASPGPYVRLSVEDTGVGIAPEGLAQIFEPFFTTKEAGKGTGLGLALVREVATSHGGWVDVSSSPGRGTVFRVYLPATPPEAAEPSGELDRMLERA